MSLRKLKFCWIAALTMAIVFVFSNEAIAQDAKSEGDKPKTEQKDQSTKKEKEKKSDKKTKKANIRKQKKQELERIAKDTLPDLRRFEVVGGVLREIKTKTLTDSVKRNVIATDSMLKDTIPSDSMTKLLSKRDQRRLKELQDSTITRHSRIFRDSIPISRMTAISFIAPGFSQLYNRQAWKIPILYGVAGSAIYAGLRFNKTYKGYKKTYDGLVRINAPQSERNSSESAMIKYNTLRQIAFAGALATYIYFIGEGAVNYKGTASPVKKATTLSTICPGAGQVYNKSYWKVPIVLGGLATMAYIIDFNARGYKRFQLAYDLITDGNDKTIDEFNGRYSEEFVRNLRNSYRRNRDLSIILTGAVYLLNIVDAHVDAHLKDYDISDDLAFKVEPSIMNFYSQKAGSRNVIGMCFSFKF